MTWRVGTPLGRLLALLILLGAGAGAAALTLVPLAHLNQRLELRLADLQQRVAVQRRIAAAGAGLEPKLEALTRAYEGDAHYLTSATEALAGAELQGMVKKAILAKGASILSTQIVAAEPDGRFTPVVLRVKMRAFLAQTVDVFYALETGETHIFLDNVSLVTRASPGRPRPGFGDSEPLLEIQFDLSGYLRGDTSRS